MLVALIMKHPVCIFLYTADSICRSGKHAAVTNRQVEAEVRDKKYKVFSERNILYIFNFEGLHLLYNLKTVDYFTSIQKDFI